MDPPSSWPTQIDDDQLMADYEALSLSPMTWLRIPRILVGFFKSFWYSSLYGELPLSALFLASLRTLSATLSGLSATLSATPSGASATFPLTATQHIWLRTASHHRHHPAQHHGTTTRRCIAACPHISSSCMRPAGLLTYHSHSTQVSPAQLKPYAPQRPPPACRLPPEHFLVTPPLVGHPT